MIYVHCDVAFGHCDVYFSMIFTVLVRRIDVPLSLLLVHLSVYSSICVDPVLPDVEVLFFFRSVVFLSEFSEFLGQPFINMVRHFKKYCTPIGNSVVLYYKVSHAYRKQCRTIL